MQPYSCYRRERYGPLDLDESKVYSCIRLAGEFIGMIERLFQALKVEIKQFNEFENWLEQGKRCHMVGSFHGIRQYFIVFFSDMSFLLVAS